MIAIVGFFSIAITIFFSINTLLELKNAQSLLAKIESNMYHLRKSEKEFLSDKDLKYKNQFANTCKVMTDNFESLQNILKSGSLSSSLEKTEILKDSIREYKNVFLKIVNIQKEIGFSKADGLMGTLNDSVIKAQEMVRRAGFTEAILLMYKLKNYEKEFILYHNKEDIERFKKVHQKILRLLNSGDNMCSDDNTPKYKLYLQKYEDSFIGLAKAMEHRGFSSDSGLLGSMNQILSKAENITQELSNELENSLKEKINFTIVLLIISLVVVIVITLTGSYIISHRVINQLKEFYESITNSSEQIANISSGVARHALSLSSSAKVQNKTIEELSATAEELTASTKENSNSAENANELSKDINDSAQSGYSDIQNLTESMTKINDSSTQIANIIKAIDEIAFQTNLLALNAAVEAARAGAHGMGFAVVAEEVRELAGKSAGAAKETSGIIENAISEVTNGNMIANDVNVAFNNILKKIEQNKETVENISYASHEQNQEMEQIHNSITNIDQTTNQMTESSENLAESSDELNSLIQEFNSVLISVKELIGVDRR
jgi:methyl-accepting chemotaxis protein